LDDNQNAERLVLAIVQNAHAGNVQGALVEKKFRVTRINTAGGFLRKGNVTLLIGVAADQVDEVIEVIREHTPKTERQDPGEPDVATMLFVLPVARFARI
jgi:uncharacterized protein YaaQ